MAKGNPEELLEQFTGPDGYARIVEELGNKLVEGLFLDFKEAKENGKPIADGSFPKGLKRTLAKALSGFANANGGIVIWGVSAKAPGTESPEPIKNLRAFEDSIRRHSHDLVLPPTPFDHRRVETRPGSDVGFVVTYIPEGRPKGIMCVYDSDNRYYLRTGDACVPASDSIVRALIRDRAAPELLLEARPGRVDFERLETNLIGRRTHGIVLLGVSEGEAVGSGRTSSHLVSVRDGDRDLQAKLIRCGLPTIYPGTAAEILLHITRSHNPLREDKITIRYSAFAEGFAVSGEALWQNDEGHNITGFAEAKERAHLAEHESDSRGAEDD